MTGLFRVGRTAIRLQWMLMASMAFVSTACSNGDHLVSSEGPLTPVDSLEPPGDPLPPPTDTAAPPPPPADTAGPPPPPPPTDTTAPPLPPSDPPVHTGIPFGPFVYTKGESEKSLTPPSSLNPDFNALVAAAYAPVIIAKLEAARRASDRVLLSLAGSGQMYRDENGFNMDLWKRRIDRFRGIDISLYIADGTLIGNFILDEPSDPSNWNGDYVTQAEIDEMARYSKEIWPDLPTIIRGWPAYLKGYQYKYLDAAWAQYHERLGPIDAFIEKNVREAKEVGLELVAGLNLLGGGGKDGLPGYSGGNGKRNAMSASQIRSWGSRYLDEPYICAFLMWSYQADYVNRADIKAALEEISQKARSYPTKKCRR